MKYVSKLIESFSGLLVILNIFDLNLKFQFLTFLTLGAFLTWSVLLVPSSIKKNPFFFNSTICLSYRLPSFAVRASNFVFSFWPRAFHSSAIFLIFSVEESLESLLVACHSLPQKMYGERARLGVTVSGSNSRILPFLAISVLFTPSELKKWPSSLNCFISFAFRSLSCSFNFWYGICCFSVNNFHFSVFYFVISVIFKSGLAFEVMGYCSFMKNINAVSAIFGFVALVSVAAGG